MHLMHRVLYNLFLLKYTKICNYVLRTQITRFSVSSHKFQYNKLQFLKYKMKCTVHLRHIDSYRKHKKKKKKIKKHMNIE